MKKRLFLFTIVTMLVLSLSLSFAVEKTSVSEEYAVANAENIVGLLQENNITLEEIEEDIVLAMKEFGWTRAQVLAQMAYEYNDALIPGGDGVENLDSIQGKGGSTIVPYARTLTNSVIGDLFFERDASTLGIKHGHIGIYVLGDTIVESIPGAGVRKIKATSKKVNPGTSIRRVSTTYDIRSKAASWANSRVGKDKYSYNFAANRLTKHEGAKNCSKLVWSAYKVSGNLDLDHNTGIAVLPWDIIKHSKVKWVSNIYN